MFTNNTVHTHSVTVEKYKSSYTLYSDTLKLKSPFNMAYSSDRVFCPLMELIRLRQVTQQFNLLKCLFKPLTIKAVSQTNTPSNVNTKIHSSFFVGSGQQLSKIRDNTNQYQDKSLFPTSIQEQKEFLQAWVYLLIYCPLFLELFLLPLGQYQPFWTSEGCVLFSGPVGCRCSSCG